MAGFYTFFLFLVVIYLIRQNLIKKFGSEVDVLKTRIDELEKDLKQFKNGGLILKGEVSPEKLNPETPTAEDPITEKPLEKPVVIEQRASNEVVFVPPTPRPDPQPTPNPISQPQRVEPQPKVPKEKSNLEKFIGENILSIIGVVTFVLGIGYFVKYAIDQNWIGETARMLIGILVGTAVIGVAHRLKKNYRWFSSILVGGGISILYFSITLGFREYHLFSQTTAFIILSLITLLAIILALLYGRQELSVFSIIGGFCAPLMVSTGENNYLFLFSYIALLNFSTLFIAYRKNWQWIGLISFGLTYVYVGSSFISTPDLSNLAYFFNILFFLQFLVLGLIGYYKKDNFNDFSLVFIVIGQILSACFLMNTLDSDLKSPFDISIVPFGFAFFDALMAVIFIRKKEKSLENIFVALLLGMIALGIPLEFQANIVVILWAIMACVVLYISQIANKKLFQIAFIVTTALVFFALQYHWIMSSYKNGVTPFYNKYFLTSCVVIGTLFINMFLLRKIKEGEKFLGINPLHLKNVFAVYSVVVIYVSILVEVIRKVSQYESFSFIICVILLYTITFIMVIVLISKFLDLSVNSKFFFSLFAILLATFYAPSVGIVEIITHERFKMINYWFYLLYLVPTFYFYWKLITGAEYQKHMQKRLVQWFLFVCGTFILCYELYNFIMLFNYSGNDLRALTRTEKHFQMIYLPILWAVLGISLIYFGLKKNLTQLPIMAFSLFAIIVLKLYLYDVWMMDNISRIISFIVLGLLIIIGSFTYQRFKKLFINLYDTPTDKTPE